MMTSAILSILFSIQCLFVNPKAVQVYQPQEQDWEYYLTAELLTEEPPLQPFSDYDVNEEGSIALRYTYWEEWYLCFYDSQGNYLFGYSLPYFRSGIISWEDTQTLKIVKPDSDYEYELDYLTGTVKRKPTLPAPYSNFYRPKKMVRGNKVFDFNPQYKSKFLNHITYRSQIRVKTTGEEAVLIFDASRKVFGRYILELLYVMCLLPPAVINARKTIKAYHAQNMLSTAAAAPTEPDLPEEEEEWAAI